MTHRSLRKIWNGIGLSCALLLGLSWADSSYHDARWHSGSSPSGGWTLEIISANSALHLLVTENSPLPSIFAKLGLGSSMRPWTSLRAIEETDIWKNSRTAFPLPFAAWEKTAIPSDTFDHFSPTLCGRMLPSPVEIGTEAIYLILPYWLLLSAGVALWMLAPALMKKPKRGITAPKNDLRG